MTAFANDLIQSLIQAIAHAKGQGTAIIHTPIEPAKHAPKRT
jgi:putative transcriptional regulator